MPKKKDILLILGLLLAACLLFLLSQYLPKPELSDKVAEVTMAPDAVEYIEETPAPTDAPVPEETASPEETVAPEETAVPQEAAMPMGPAGPAPQEASAVRGYAVITVGGRQYGDPVPMDRDKVITIRQENGEINRIHVTPEAVWMESSTCDNQDCVGEGEITPENYKTRVLSTWIICLPNQVTVEFIPAEGM